MHSSARAQPWQPPSGFRGTPDIRNELRRAGSPEHLCELLCAQCEIYGAVRCVDLLPLPGRDRCLLVCLVEMQTEAAARSAQAALMLSPFGYRSLVCIVEAVDFDLLMPSRFVAQGLRAA